MVEDKLAYRWHMLLGIVLVSLFVSGICMAVMPALFDEIEEELNLTHAQIGIIWSAAALGGLLTAIPGGVLGDRFGVKRVVAVGIVVSTISCALRAILPGFGGLVLAMLLFGMAMGFLYPNIQKAVGMWFGPDELGKALGAIIVGGAAGFSVALMAAAAISDALGGWKNVMWLTAAISLGTLFVWMALARDRPVTSYDSPTQGLSVREGLRRVLRVRDLWFLALMLLCIQGVAMAAVGLLPETLEDRGMSATMAGIYVSISTWTVMVFNIIGPYFSDRFGLRKPFIWPFLVVCVASITFFGVFTGAPLVIVIVLYSLGLGTALPLFGAIVIEHDRIGPLLAGSALGVIGTVAGIGPVVIPIVMGAVMDVGEYWHGFFLLAVLLAVGTAAVVGVKETGQRAKQAASPGT